MNATLGAFGRKNSITNGRHGNVRSETSWWVLVTIMSVVERIRPAVSAGKPIGHPRQLGTGVTSCYHRKTSSVSCATAFLNLGPLFHPDWSSDHAGLLSYWFHFWTIIQITRSPALSLRARGGRFVVNADWGHRLALFSSCTQWSKNVCLHFRPAEI